MSKKFVKKLSSVEKFKSIKLTNSQEKVFSLNHTMLDDALVKNAKTIIVGTLTPGNGMFNGYYYTSLKNKVYKIIDENCNKSNVLVNLKKQLANNKDDEEIIGKIKENLLKNKLAFIDVIDEAIRECDSYQDDKISAFTLDYGSFKHCSQNQIFICTSQNTADCLNLIAEKINLNKDNIFVCHQDRFHYPADKNLWTEKLTMN